jgi:hypothetical protein
MISSLVSSTKRSEQKSTAGARLLNRVRIESDKDYLRKVKYKDCILGRGFSAKTK